MRDLNNLNKEHDKKIGENKMKAGTFTLKENWNIKTVEKLTGKILQEEEKCNLIVNDGLERVAKLLNGVSSIYFRAIAIGTGTTSATNSDTELEIEYTRALATLSYEADYKAKFTKTFSFGSGVSEDITEAGIFDSDTVSGSIMLARTTFTSKSVSPDVDLIVTATITIARV
jgi:hypothetical protein